MGKFLIDPVNLRQFGETEGIHFQLVTSPSLKDAFEIGGSGGYGSRSISLMTSMAELFDDLKSNAIPNDSHVLVIAPDVFFQSPPPEVLGGRRKLMAMACNSTSSAPDAIEHFLAVMHRTDPEDQRNRTDKFFSDGEASEYFRFVDAQYKTEAIFHHLDEAYLWNEQTGFLGWGEQQIAPAGEISVLPLEMHKFDEYLHFALSGSIAFKGQPVLHNGSSSFLRSDQARLFAALEPMVNHAVIAQVESGRVVSLLETHPSVLPARKMLEAMFEVDSRYRTIWEIGFAVNRELDIFPGNHAMNEVYGGQEGCVHWGLGLTPHTQYHLDIITPGTVIYNQSNDIVFGQPANQRMRRTNEFGCGCAA